MDTTLFSTSKIVTATSLLIAAFLIVLVMIYGSTTLIPIVIAIGLWGLLNAMTNYIHGIKIGRFQLPKWLSLTVGLLIIILLLLRFIGTLVQNIGGFIVELPTYTENLNNLLLTLPQSLWISLLGENADLSVGLVEQLFTLAADYFSSSLTTFASSAANLATNALYIIVYVIFLLLEQGTFATKAHNMFTDNAQRAEFREILDSINQQVQTYVAVKTLVSLMTGIISYIIMWLFGLDYAIIWAILIFILNYIPNIGSIIAVIFPVLMGLLQFGNFATVGGLLVALGVVQLAIGNFIEPRLMGNQLNISSFVVLVALGVFGSIWGIAGMFLSVPLTVVIMIILSHFDATRFIAVMLSGDGIVYGVEAAADVPG
ncbi:MAG: AI-2E family transporter [Chloroflexota bacterium]